MARFLIHLIAVALSLLTIIPTEVSPATLPGLRPTRSMCLYQFSLASQTCALLPPQQRLIANMEETNSTSRQIEQSPSPSSSPKEEEEEEEEERRDERRDRRSSDHDHGGRRERSRGSSRSSRRRGSSDSSRRRSGSHRRHRQQRHRGHQVVQEECCKWLTQMDSACVCDVLRHLPIFLIRPQHSYTVRVEDYCEVKFPCDPLF